MNWEAIGAAAEIVGAGGVIVSLGYLAIQIRQSSSDARHTSVDRLVEMWATHIGGFAENRPLAAIWIKSLQDKESLTEEEQAMLFAHLARLLRVSEAIHIHHRDKTIDAGLWAGIDTALSDVVATPILRQYWPIRKHWFGPQFQDYVSKLIEARAAIDFYPNDPTS